AHARDVPPALRQRRPDVPEAVQAMVEKLLAKKPEDRYASAHDVIAALGTAATALPSPAGVHVTRPARNALVCRPSDRYARAGPSEEVLVEQLQKQAAPSENIGGEVGNSVPAPLSRKGWFRELVAAVALAVLVGGMGYLASRRTADGSPHSAIDGSI